MSDYHNSTNNPWQEDSNSYTYGTQPDFTYDSGGYGADESPDANGYSPDQYHVSSSNQFYPADSYGTGPYAAPPTDPYAAVPARPNSYGPATSYSSYVASSKYAPEAGRPWSGMGMIGMILALIALAIGIGLSIWGGNLVGELTLIGEDYGDIDRIPSNHARATELQTSFGLATIGMVLPSLLGLVGLILSIIGIASNKGKSAGIFGLIVSLLAPIISFSILIAAGVARIL